MIRAQPVSPTKIKYDERVVFSISRIGALRGKSSGWACAHSQTRGEKHSDYREKRRAQRGEGHKKSRAHGGLRVHALIQFGAVPAAIQLSEGEVRLDEIQFRTQTV